LGGVENIGNQKEFSDVEKREGSGDSKSQTPMERRCGNRRERGRPCIVICPNGHIISYCISEKMTGTDADNTEINSQLLTSFCCVNNKGMIL
jgi:hypothetical protein